MREAKGKRSCADSSGVMAAFSRAPAAPPASSRLGTHVAHGVAGADSHSAFTALTRRTHRLRHSRRRLRPLHSAVPYPIRFDLHLHQRSPSTSSTVSRGPDTPTDKRAKNRKSERRALSASAWPRCAARVFHMAAGSARGHALLVGL